MAIPSDGAHESRFDALLERGRAERESERLEEALQTFARAEALAEEAGDPRRVDRAFINRCALLIERERRLPPEYLHRLRQTLMSADCDVNSRLAAYNMALVYECSKEHRKGLFYARIALDRSRLLGISEWLASSHNQMGNLLLAESRFEEGLDAYEEALRHLPSGPSRRKALILTNLGYAREVAGLEGGLEYLYRSLRMLRSVGIRRDQVFPHLDLCFALMERGRFRHALKHGARALNLAEESGEDEDVKHALFLLGEVAQEIGDPARARSLFERLQKRFFPEIPQLADMLLSLDVRKLVNLKA